MPSYHSALFAPLCLLLLLSFAAPVCAAESQPSTEPRIVRPNTDAKADTNPTTNSSANAKPEHLLPPPASSNLPNGEQAGIPIHTRAKANTPDVASPDVAPPTEPLQDKDVVSETDSTAAETDRLFSRDYHLCMDAAAGTTIAMQDCITAETDRLDARIVEQSTRLIPQLSEERAKALTESLTAWDSLRKSGSAAMYDPDGGTLATIIASLWYLEQTARTSHWLDGLLESSTS